MMKKNYIVPEIAWIAFCSADVITLSELTLTEEGGGDNWNWYFTRK